MNRLGNSYVKQEFQVTVAKDPSEVSTLLVDFTVERDGRIEAADTEHVVAKFGSRIRFRLLGLYLKAGRDHVPIILLASLKSKANQTVVNVVLKSDEGWYVFSVPLLSEILRNKFYGMEADLRSRISSP